MEKFKHIPVGTKVIVRGSASGVIYGNFVEATKDYTVVTKGRQLWEWRASKGISLIDVATFGVEASKCKFSAPDGEVTILDACALIIVTAAAAKSIEAVPVSRT